jgi:hypothetical protein
MEDLLERLREGLEELDALASMMDDSEEKVEIHETITDLIETVAELDIEINGEPV